jgi:hypothetical protein
MAVKPVKRQPIIPEPAAVAGKRNDVLSSGMKIASNLYSLQILKGWLLT